MSRILGNFLPVLLAFTAGCAVVEGNGRITEVDLEVGEFERLEVHNALRVNWVVGPATGSATLIGESNLLEWVEVREVGRKLVVEVRDNAWLQMKEPITLEVSAPSLERISLWGASQLVVDGKVVAEQLSLDLSGASKAELPEADAGRIVAELSGASRLRIGGVSDELALRGSGASRIDAEQFVTNVLDVELSGASSARVAVVEQATGDLSGASSLVIEGDPRGRIHTSGGSSVDYL